MACHCVSRLHGRDALSAQGLIQDKTNGRLCGLPGTGELRPKFRECACPELGGPALVNAQLQSDLSRLLQPA
jgi:hypothetical protein